MASEDIIFPCVFGTNEGSCMYLALLCSVKLLRVLLYWLITEALALRRGAVSTKRVRVPCSLSMCVVAQNGVNLQSPLVSLRIAWTFLYLYVIRAAQRSYINFVCLRVCTYGHHI